VKRKITLAFVTQYVETLFKLKAKNVTLVIKRDVKNVRKQQMDGFVQETSKQRQVNVLRD